MTDLSNILLRKVPDDEACQIEFPRERPERSGPEVPIVSPYGEALVVRGGSIPPHHEKVVEVEDTESSCSASSSSKSSQSASSTSTKAFSDDEDFVEEIASQRAQAMHSPFNVLLLLSLCIIGMLIGAHM